MVTFPNCKINLGLNIIAKRPDGYHDLETVFYPLAITDVLEIVQLPDQTETIAFTATGLTIEGDASTNLCVKAFHLLKQDFPDLPAINMHLHKHIPMGAGLGGGSADGAFALKMLNDKFQLKLSSDQLISYSLQLGSDCPFFIINQPCFAEGRGERLTPVSLDLSDYRFIIIYPSIHISTGQAFSKLHPKQPVKSIKDIIIQPVETWKAELVNDFEEVVFASHPAIKAIKENLYTHGAVYASMTGSGSTVFGIFKKEQDLMPIQQQYSNYLTRVV